VGGWEWAKQHPTIFNVCQHLFVWIISLSSAAIPWAYDAYRPGLDQVACSFGGSRLWRLLDVIPPACYILFSIFVVVYVYRHIRPSSMMSGNPHESARYEGHHKTQKRALWRILLFVLVFIVRYNINSFLFYISRFHVHFVE
jgi:hypothetical protein